MRNAARVIPDDDETLIIVSAETQSPDASIIVPCEKVHLMCTLVLAL